MDGSEQTVQFKHKRVCPATQDCATQFARRVEPFSLHRVIRQIGETSNRRNISSNLPPYAGTAGWKIDFGLQNGMRVVTLVAPPWRTLLRSFREQAVRQ